MKRAIRLGFAAAFAASGFLTASAAAQTPVSFLPGINEGPGVWFGTGASLASSFSITPSYPFLATDDPFQTQSASLGALASSTVLVGHSAGGIVARLHGQSQALGGIITLGTPNYGAPLEETYPVFCEYLGVTAYDLFALGLAIDPSSDQWLIYELEPDYDWVVDLLGSMCDLITVESGVLGSANNQDQLPPGSAFMQGTLNAAANVQAEQTNVPNEASVVVVTSNFIDAGPYKAIDPDGAGEAWGHIVQGLAATMLSAGVYIELYQDPNMDDPHAWDIAERLINLGNDLLFVDDAWCQSVEGTLFFCNGNDEIVPTWSQNLGRGHFFEVPNGPVHTREAQQGAVLLPQAFSAVGIH